MVLVTAWRAFLVVTEMMNYFLSKDVEQNAECTEKVILILIALVLINKTVDQNHWCPRAPAIEQHDNFQTFEIKKISFTSRFLFSVIT